jgi:hypothetical protein
VTILCWLDRISASNRPLVGKKLLLPVNYTSEDTQLSGDLPFLTAFLRNFWKLSTILTRS